MELIVRAAGRRRYACPITVACEPDADACSLACGADIVATQRDGDRLAAIIAVPSPDGEPVFTPVKEHRVAPVALTDDGSAILVAIGGEPFTTYRYAGVPARPYFWPVLAPGGVPVTRAWPMRDDVPGETHDHKHHRSMYFAFGEVNGVDNWSEEPGHGHTVHRSVDQIVSGVAINIFATGATSFISSRFLERNTDALNNSGTFPVIAIPFLSKIPIIGPILFENNIIVYLMILLVIFIYVLLFYTPWGLRTRAVGEHPKAADTLGINVYLMRYVNVILGGAIAGIGGAYFSIGSVGRFDEIMTAGKGFIGLAAMIFGKWNPIGAFLSSLLFGFADSLQVKLQILRVPIPSEFLLMAPYIVTMIVLAGVVGRAIPPVADGVPYEKD